MASGAENKHAVTSNRKRRIVGVGRGARDGSEEIKPRGALRDERGGSGTTQP